MAGESPEELVDAVLLFYGEMAPPGAPEKRHEGQQPRDSRARILEWVTRDEILAIVKRHDAALIESSPLNRLAPSSVSKAPVLNATMRELEELLRKRRPA